ncbi:hypothetical protein EMCRGX_G012740 [Ephydatia muelleri]
MGKITLSVRLGSFLDEHEFIVVKELTVECLLGADFMEKNDVLIDFRRKCLKLGRNDVEVSFIDSNSSGNNRMEDSLVTVSQTVQQTRTSLHESTGYSPYLVNFERSPVLPVDVMLGRFDREGNDGNIPQYIKEVRKTLKNAYDEIRVNLDVAQEKRKDSNAVFLMGFYTILVLFSVVAVRTSRGCYQQLLNFIGFQGSSRSRTHIPGRAEGGSLDPLDPPLDPPLTGEEKLKWLKVRLTGKAQTAFKKLPQDVKENYGECIKSLQRRFDPDSKRQLYVAELSARTRHKDEDWATFGDVLRVLADKAYPDLEEKARERLALNQFLAQIENAQVAFGVKQKRPTNVEEAVVATIELESYLGSSGKPLRVSAVSPQEPDPDVRVRRADRAEAVAAVSPLDEPQTVKLLGERLQRLEMLLEKQGSSTRPRTKRPYCKILSESRNRAASGKLQSLSGKSLPREGRRHVEAQTDQLTVPSLSVTCGVSYSVKGVIGVVAIAFVVDTGAAVSLIRKDVWTQLVNRDSTLVLEQWSGKKLVGVNGASLSICGCGNIQVLFKGTPFMVTCIVTDDITIEAILGLDFLEANSCVIDCGQKVLTFPSQKLSIPFLSKTTTEQGVTTVGLVLKEKTVVPAGSEMEVMVKIAGPVTNVVSPSSNVVPVRILNPRDEMVVLKKGTQIASMELLEQDPVINISTVMKNAEVSLECQNILWDLVSKVGSHISESEREQLYSLLVEFADVFSFSSKDLGRTKELKHHIFTSDAQPVHLSPRRIPQARREELRGLLRDMLESDVIQQSDSPWSSPIVLAKKHDGTIRFCVDYKKVNEVTRKDAYPLPRVDDTLDTLVGSKFTTLDLASGYWQVEVAPEDQPKTAFTTPEGLYQFKSLHTQIMSDVSYSTRMQVMLELVLCFHRQYLLGREFTLRTDHGSLVWIRNFKEPEGQLARWLERLQEYNFTVVHRQGLRHCNADALSRVPCRQCGRDEDIESETPSW